VFAGLVMAAGIVMGLAPSPASAAPAATSPARPGAVTTHAISKAEQLATLRYWTKQRRESAHWISTPNVTPTQVRGGAPAVPSGSPGRVGGGLPANATPAKATAALAARARHGYRQALAANSPYPFPYNSINVPDNDYLLWPFRVNGVIFFTNNGVGYRCSGTSVASASGASNENEVWTAGHCVANTNLSSPGIWDSFAEFIPAYNGTAANPAPFGVFVATGFSTAFHWLENGDFSLDEGAMTVGTNAFGQTLGQAVGWDGFAWNQSTNQSFTAFGYPAAPPYTGNFMVIDFASTAALVSVGAGQPAIGIGNPMTGGSSGGAWNIDWGLNGGPGYINGHNDFKFSSQPLAMYSPYQDTLSNVVRCFGASNC
jgi:hypothetical protein